MSKWGVPDEYAVAETTGGTQQIPALVWKRKQLLIRASFNRVAGNKGRAGSVIEVKILDRAYPNAESHLNLIRPPPADQEKILSPVRELVQRLRRGNEPATRPATQRN